MGMVRETGVVPVSLRCAAEAIYEGMVYKDDGSGRMTKITNVTDTPVAVALESSIDPKTGAAKTMTAGDSMPFALVGSGAIVSVRSENSTTYQSFGAVYTCQSAGTDGYCDSNNTNNAVKFGHYLEPDNHTTTAAGEFITVILDVAPAA